MSGSRFPHKPRLLNPLVSSLSHQQSSHFPDHDERDIPDLISEGVVCVYLDDILIFTETMEEHDRVTRLVLERLRQYKTLSPT